MTDKPAKKRSRIRLPDHRGFHVFVTTGGQFIAEDPKDPEMKSTASTLGSLKRWIVDHTQEPPEKIKAGDKVLVKGKHFRRFDKYEPGKLTGRFARKKSWRWRPSQKEMFSQVELNKKDRKGDVVTRWFPLNHIFPGTAKQGTEVNKLIREYDKLADRLRKQEKKMKSLEGSEATLY